MRMRCFFCALFSFLLSVSLLSSVFSLNADAAVSGGRYMTEQETLDLFGSEIPCKYFDGEGYAEGVFRYVRQRDVDSVSSGYKSPSGYLTAGTPALMYRLDAKPSTNINYITVDVQPQYSIFDTEIVHSFISLTFSSSLGEVYQSPSWDWYVDGAKMHIENNSIESDGNRSSLSIFGCVSTFVEFSYSGQSSISCYSERAVFSGNSGCYDSSNYMYLSLGLPYVSTDAFGSQGTIGGTTSGGSSGGDVNVNVEVDMSETNGLLGSLISAVQGIASSILDGIKGLFVPSEEDLTAFSEDMEALAQEHLGGLYQAWQLLEDFFAGLKNVTSKSSITIPACSLPLAGETFTLGPYDVPLKVDGMPSVLYESIAFIIDFLVTAAFINMCKRKLEIFLNPDSEVITDDS